MTSPGHVVVIGGGFAGLACAVALAGRGIRVTVLEARRTLGGRAGSFADDATGETVDNGQHLLMACYTETRRFLRRIGTEALIHFQENLTVDYLEAGLRFRLRCPPLPAPWHLVTGVLALKGLALADRASLLRAAAALRRLRTATDAAALSDISVTAWLDQIKQTPRLRRWLWHPLAIATLNESPDVAPASLLARVLVEAFLRDRASSGLGIPTVGLSDLYTEASRRHIEQQGGAVRCGMPVVRLKASGSRIEAVEARDGESIRADAFVSSVPPQPLARLGIALHGYERFASSPILSVNLWLDRPVSEIADFDFACVVGGHVQWLFNKERIFGGKATHLAAVMSAARDLVRFSNEELGAMVWEDIRSHLPAARVAKVVRSMVVRERTATFSATIETEPLRPGPRSPYENLLLSGDWTERGLPATIETAVRSGHRCADMLTSSDSD